MMLTPAADRPIVMEPGVMIPSIVAATGWSGSARRCDCGYTVDGEAVVPRDSVPCACISSARVTWILPERDSTP